MRRNVNNVNMYICTYGVYSVYNTKKIVTCFLWDVYFLWDGTQPSLPILRAGLRKRGGNFGRLLRNRLVVADLDLTGFSDPRSNGPSQFLFCL